MVFTGKGGENYRGNNKSNDGGGSFQDNFCVIFLTGLFASEKRNSPLFQILSKRQSRKDVEVHFKRMK